MTFPGTAKRGGGVAASGNFWALTKFVALEGFNFGVTRVISGLRVRSMESPNLLQGACEEEIAERPNSWASSLRGPQNALIHLFCENHTT